MRQRVIVVLVGLLAPLSVYAQSDTASIKLTYSEQTATDSTRAAVARLLITAAPATSWRADSGRVDESKEETVLRLYRYYRSDFPTTTAVLIAAIDSANEFQESRDWAGRRLRIPPVPERGYAQYGFAPAYRAFDSVKRQYAFFEARQSDDETRYLFARTDSAPPAGSFQNAAIRNGTRTVVTVPISRRLLAAARRILESARDELALSSASGLVPIELYRGEQSACSDAADWFRDSPYRAEVLAEASSLSPAERDTLIERAKRVPLIVVDWEHLTGHGSKVESVVSATLDSLGYGFLKPHVTRIDLNPLTNAAGLSALLTEYEGSLPARQKTVGRLREIAAARDWLTKVTSATEQTHEQIMLAVFWKALSKGPGVANMSFGVPHPILELNPPNLPTDGRSFGVLAAGNDKKALVAGTSIQNVAWAHPALINVTSSDARGFIAGTFSDTVTNAIVSLAAPGCGYKSGTIVEANSGSSFASPFVAASVWVFKLRNPGSASSLRGRLTMASWPFPPLSKPVQGDGRFDPWLFLRWPSRGAHAVMDNGKIHSLTNMQLDVVIAGERVILAQDAVRPVARGFVVGDDNGVSSAWYRKRHSDAPVRGMLSGASGTMKLGNDTVSFGTVAELRQRGIRALWF